MRVFNRQPKINRFKDLLTPYLYTFAKEIFHFTLITYCILLIFEIIKTGFVTYFFNLDILIWILLTSGIIILLLSDNKTLRNTTSFYTTTERIWHRFFTQMSGKIGSNSKWNFLFKEMRTNEMINRKSNYNYRDLYLQIKNVSYLNWIQENYPTFYKYRYLGIQQTEWDSFFKQIKITAISKKESQYSMLLSLGGTFLLFYKIKELGLIALIISILSGCIIYLFLTFLLLEE